MTVNNPGGGGSAAITGTQQGTAAARPAAASAPAGAIYWATDTGELSVNNLTQTAWQTIGRISTATLNINGIISMLNSGVNGRVTWPGNAWIAGSGGSLIQLANPSSLDISVAGSGLQVAEGSNAKQGVTGAMSAGAVTVANTSVTASSRIFVCRNAGGTNPGAWYVSAQTAATSFVATSTNAADTGTGVYEIFEPG